MLELAWGTNEQEKGDEQVDELIVRGNVRKQEGCQGQQRNLLPQLGFDEQNIIGNQTSHGHYGCIIRQDQGCHGHLVDQAGPY